MANSQSKKRKRHATASFNDFSDPRDSHEVGGTPEVSVSEDPTENSLNDFRLQKHGRSKVDVGVSFFNKKTLTQTRGNRNVGPSGFETDDCLNIEDNTPTYKGTHPNESISSKSVQATPKLQQKTFQVKPSNLFLRRDNSFALFQGELSVNTPWIDLFPPLRLDELAVNKKKVAEVSTWLQEALKGHPYRRLLVLKGPAGCGKTATIKILADRWGITVTEWLNPSKLDFDADNYASLTARFDDFLNRGSTFTSLGLEGRTAGARESYQNQQAKCGIILIDDFPTSVQHVAQALATVRESFTRYLETRASTPVVLVFSEEEGHSTDSLSRPAARSLLGSQILDHPAAATIEFNRLAPTFMIKAVEQVIRKEACISHRNFSPSQAVLSHIVQSGDIRSAIGMLQILCINNSMGSHKIQISSKSSARNSKKDVLTGEERKSLDGILHRESYLGLFHAVGKIVYNKREGESSCQPPSYLNKYHRKNQSNVDVNDIMDHLGVDVDTFVSALYENYVPSCESSDSLNAIEDASIELSSADILGGKSVPWTGGILDHHFRRADSMDLWRQDEIAFHVAARGLLFSLPFPVKRSSRPSGKDHQKLMFPVIMKLHTQQKATLQKVESWLRDSDKIANERKSVSALVNQGCDSVTAQNAFNEYSRQAVISPTSGMVPLEPMARVSFEELLQYQMPLVALLDARPCGARGFQSLLSAVSMGNYMAHDATNVSTALVSRSDRVRTSSPIRVDEQCTTMNLFLSDDDIEDL